ncbi:MAG: DUF1080 domain-containing protein [Sphingomicrobium sp.]
MFVAALALAVAAPPPEKLSVEQEAAIAADPAFKRQRLRLVDVPVPTGPGFSLFNGRDLDDWETWLGYPDPSVTYQKPPVKPIGANQGKGTIFKVVEADGAPAIFVDGTTWGSIVHKKVVSNYHLRLQYRWTGKRHAPRLEQPENNGLLYHSGGPHGAVWGTWMRSVEFEIMKGSTGMVVPVGDDVRVTTEVGKDPNIIYPRRRFMIGGKKIDVRQPAWNVENAQDFEYPVGLWNTLDLYVVGDRSVHVVNDHPVMVLSGLSVLDSAGKKQPLTEGRIQFQSEGAETLFRNITVEPISSLPKVEIYGAAK